jgi:NAD(P)-dependent dehydrogenase (short-subunit alcohol dehydrogenase family)
MCCNPGSTAAAAVRSDHIRSGASPTTNREPLRKPGRQRTGLLGGAGRTTYHATKHGVLGAINSVGLQYGQRGVRVNAVCSATGWLL